MRTLWAESEPRGPQVALMVILLVALPVLFMTVLVQTFSTDSRDSSALSTMTLEEGADRKETNRWHDEFYQVPKDNSDWPRKRQNAPRKGTFPKQLPPTWEPEEFPRR